MPPPSAQRGIRVSEEQRMGYGHLGSVWLGDYWRPEQNNHEANEVQMPSLEQTPSKALEYQIMSSHSMRQIERNLQDKGIFVLFL